jgi:hypothetical protein
VKNRQVLVDAYQAATRKEQELWARMNGRGPGQPGFDRELFDKWMEAVAQTTAASKALREAFAEPKKPDKH